MRALALAMGRFSYGSSGRAAPLWIVAACGVLAGAVTAKALGSSAALALPPAEVAPATPVEAVGPAKPVELAPVPAPVAAPTPLAPAAATASAPTAAVPQAPAPTAAAPQAPAPTAPPPTAPPITFLDSPEAATPHGAAPAAGGGVGGIERIVIILAVMVGGVFALAHFRKRHAAKPRPKGPELRLVGHVRVAGRWQVALVRVPGRTLVLGSTEKGLSLLATLADEANPGAEDDDAFGLSTPAGDDSVDSLLGQSVRPAAASAAARRRPSPQAPAEEPFEHFLDQLTRSTPTHTAAAPLTAPRARATASPADALRARLERYQTDARRAG